MLKKWYMGFNHLMLFDLTFVWTVPSMNSKDWRRNYLSFQNSQMREKWLISVFFIFRRLLCFIGGEIILMTQPSIVLFCYFMLPKRKITSLIFTPGMIKIYYFYWGTYQWVETHLFQDNLALKILLIAFIFNSIARTEYTQVIWFPVL